MLSLNLKFDYYNQQRKVLLNFALRTSLLEIQVQFKIHFQIKFEFKFEFKFLTDAPA